jgi:putative peptidoglycan lipid II flippase
MVSTSESERRPERLLKSTSVVGSMTLLSRISGLARDVVLSHWFGAGIVMDAFFVAFRIPNLLRRFFAEGAFSQAFVPVVSEYRATRSEEEVRALLDRVTGTLGAIVLGISVLGVLVAPLLVIAFAPGFLADRDRAALATDMLRFTFPYLLFISLTALAGGILNTYRRFAVPAFTPVLLNLVLILFAVVVAPHLPRPAMALALGVLAAGVAQLAFQLPFLRRMRLLPRPRWDLAHAGVRKIIRLMLPVLFGSSVAQINILFDTLIASFLAAGSISWLYYSDRLMEFPLGVFGIALATVILPSLSEHHAKASKEEFSETLDWALRYVLLIGLPAAIGLIVLAEPLITTIYGGGAFTARDVAMAEASLRAFAPGLLGFVLVKVLSPGYFARQDTRTPVRIGVLALLLNMVLNVVFVLGLLKSGWAPPHAGVAAATSASGIFNAAMLLAGLRKAGIYKRGPGWRRLAGQVLVACAAMTIYVLWLLGRLGDWQAMGVGGRVGGLALVVGGAIVVYFGVCWLLGLRPAAMHPTRSGGGR